MTYNIQDYGAVVSDVLQTDAIQKAIDDCYLSGGGTVLIPAGIWRTGGLRLRSHVTLHLLSGAILEGSEDPDDYCGWERDTLEPLVYDPSIPGRSANPLSRWNNALIRAVDAEDIAIVGEPYSYLDGDNCYDPVGEENYRGPHGINLQSCKNVRLAGYTIRNTGNWAHAIFKSENVVIEHITVYGGHDGIDIFLCEKVRIHNCRLDTGDDCIAGFGSRDVVIRDCVLNSSCSSIRFGGTDVVFEHCRTEDGPHFGFRGSLTPQQKAERRMPTTAARHSTHTGFLYYCDLRFGPLPHRPGNIVLRHCDFENVDSLFHMTFGEHVWCKGHALSSIRFEDCRVTGVKKPLYIWGDPADPIDFVLEDVTFTAEPGFADTAFLEANHYKSITLDRVTFAGFAQPRIVTYSGAPIGGTDSDAFVIDKLEPPEKQAGGY